MKMLFKIYSLVEEYQKTYSFATLTRSFSDTPQLVNKNRQYARIFHGVITIKGRGKGAASSYPLGLAVPRRP